MEWAEGVWKGVMMEGRMHLILGVTKLISLFPSSFLSLSLLYFWSLCYCGFIFTLAAILVFIQVTLADWGPSILIGHGEGASD